MTGSLFFFQAFCPTHFRIDSLLFGVLISYVHYYRPGITRNISRGHLAIIAAVSLVLLAVLLQWDPARSVFLATYGLTLLYVSCGGLLLVFLHWPPIVPSRSVAAYAGVAIGYIGRHSYSIYLWHLPTKLAIAAIVAHHAPDLGSRLEFAIYVLCSLVVGIVFAKLIEMPALRLRDRWAPTRSAALEGLSVAHRGRVEPEHHSQACDSPHW